MTSTALLPILAMLDDCKKGFVDYRDRQRMDEAIKMLTQLWASKEYGPDDHPEDEGDLFLVEMSGRFKSVTCTHSCTLARWFKTGWEPEETDFDDFVVHKWWRLPDAELG